MFLNIFHILHCAFLILHDFQFPHHTAGSTLCISHFPCFLVFLAIFQVLQCLCLIFHIFQFSLQNPGTTMGISHILRLSLFLTFFPVLQSVFLYFTRFSIFSPYSRYYHDFLIFLPYQFSRHIKGPTVCVSHFPHFFRFLAIFQVLQWAFLIFQVFQCFSAYSMSMFLCIIFHVFQFSCHKAGTTVYISNIYCFFTLSCHIPCPKECVSHFTYFSVFLAIFHVLQ